jgi:hypothetical protein
VNFCWTIFFFVPTLVFFGSQEAVKKFGPKFGFFLVWSSHISGIVTVEVTVKYCQLLNFAAH